jgi:hypothetical protein
MNNFSFEFGSNRGEKRAGDYIFRPHYRAVLDSIPLSVSRFNIGCIWKEQENKNQPRRSSWLRLESNELLLSYKSQTLDAGMVHTELFLIAFYS